ncbi:MAG: outer membrane beta-barrel protein [Deltaproteobacteria bacterium]|nr:outer membrane beta-barrel protein [Deltaproteobacteria bacterium]
MHGKYRLQKGVLMRDIGRHTTAISARDSFKYFCLGLPLLLLFLFFPVSFTAAESDITLSLDAQERFSDNFYRSETEKIKVYTTIIKPGITTRAWTDRSSVLFAYSPTFNYYSDDSDMVDVSKDDFVGHELAFMAETTLFERLKLNLTDRFQETREPGAYDVLRESAADRERYRINQVSPFMTYDFAEKFTVILGYQYEVYNYEDSENSYEHRGYFTLRYHLDDRNSLEVEEQYWGRRYPTNPDYDSSQTKLIFRRELSDFLKCEIGGGYHNRTFESGRAGVQDFDGFVYRLALTGESDVSRLFLSYRRNLNDFSKGTAYFDAHRVTVNVEHTFLEKLMCSLGGYYQKNDYETTTGTTAAGTTELREDEIWDGSVGIKYRMADWLSAGIYYAYSDRDSNITGQSYLEKKVYGNITFEYSSARRK